MTRWLVLCLGVWCGTFAVAADDDVPTNRLFMESLFAVRTNPQGLQERFYLSYRRKLFHSDKVMLSDTHFSVGPVLTLSPGFVAVGPQVKFQPLAILGFRVSYEVLGTFGLFGQIHQFESAEVDYSDPALKAMGAGTPRIGGQLSLEGRFQLKLGPVAIRDTFMARRYDFTSEANEVFFFDQNTDLLAPTHGWIWTHDVDLLMLAPNGITLGARLSTGMGVEMTHRLGPILAFTWYNRPGQTFNTPTIFVISQWHVAHPYRAGAVSSQWSPTVAFGFAFSGDLTPW